MKKTAAEITVGDVLIINAKTAVIINEIRTVSDKQVRFGATYVQCEFAPNRVGQSWSVTKRLGTIVETL